MIEYLTAHGVEVCIAIIGFFIIRELKKNDESRKALTKALSELKDKLEEHTMLIQERPTWEEMEAKAAEIAKHAINEHIISEGA